VGNKDGETVVNPCGREVDKRKQAVDLKVTGEVSPSGRMAIVGRYVAECRIWVEMNFCRGFMYFGRWEYSKGRRYVFLLVLSLWSVKSALFSGSFCLKWRWGYSQNR